MSTQLSVQEFQSVAPAQIKGRITQELVDTVNSMALDDEFKQNYRDNLLSYTSVMQDGKFTIEQYLNAVRYVSFKLMGDPNIKAYKRTFPAKYAKFKKQGVSDKDISSYVYAYNKTKLVNQIFEQTLIPSHVLNADMYQKALNTQADLMMNANSEKVRSDAANSILTHLKPPENKKLEVEVSHKDTSVIESLRAATAEFAKAQRDAIEVGSITSKTAAQSKLVLEGEYTEVK